MPETASDALELELQAGMGRMPWALHMLLDSSARVMYSSAC